MNITLDGSGCDKRKNHLKLCRESTALRYTPAVSLDVSDRFTGLNFEVLLFCLFSQTLARLSSGLSFKSYPLAIVMH